MHFDIDLTIDRPVSEVFDYACDLEKVPEWAGPPVKREELTLGPIGVGTRYRAIDQLPGRKVEFTEEVTRYEPNQPFAMAMSEPFNANVETRFEAENGNTRLNFSVDMRPSGIIGILSPLLTRPMKKMFSKDLMALKANLEATE
jgi:uncharacterized protein YndB with AHSA1/START domain